MVGGRHGTAAALPGTPAGGAFSPLESIPPSGRKRWVSGGALTKRLASSAAGRGDGRAGLAESRASSRKGGAKRRALREHPEGMTVTSVGRIDRAGATAGDGRTLSS